MTELIAVARLTAAAPQELHAQANARRALPLRLLEALRTAATPRDAVAALKLHHVELEQLGRFDEAARLRALTRAVEADFVLIEREAVELEARADHLDR